MRTWNTARLTTAGLILALGILFFWMNSRPLLRRGELFRSVHVFAHGEKYCDLGIVLAWLQDERSGIDIIKRCPSCPCAETPFNYGKGVLWLGRLVPGRLMVADAAWLGPLLDAAFLISVAWVLQARRIRHAVYYGWLLFSPPVFLAMERANLDVLLFSMVAAAMLLANRAGQAYSYAIIFAAGTLKFFPFAATLAFLRPVRRNRIYLLAVLTGVALFAIVTWDYLPIGRAAGIQRYSWGHAVTFALAPPILRDWAFDAQEWTAREALLVLAMWSSLTAAAAVWRRRDLMSLLAAGEPTGRMGLVAGSAIYAFCFITGNNFEYRNIFLFLIVPHLLFEVSHEGFAGRLARWGAGLILIAFTLTWLRDFDPFVVLQQTAYWLLFSFCGSICLAALIAAHAELPRMLGFGRFAR